MIDKILITLSILCYILGRISDDMNWYDWDGISSNGFQGLSLAALGASSLLIIILRARQEGGLRILLVNSQMKFIIPWGLVILECILDFNIFGCTPDDQELSVGAINRTGCVLYCVCILLTNFIYSSICYKTGELPFLVAFEIVMFAEIVYFGNLLVKFIDELEDKHKDYSILFISIMIAWLIITMDLIFRQAYEEKEKEEHHLHLEGIVVEHYEKVRAKKSNYQSVPLGSGERGNVGMDSQGALQREREDIVVEEPVEPKAQGG